MAWSASATPIAHIIDLFRALDVDNITWVFHIDAYNDPNTPWNQMAGYYPGDDYIDWIGVSAYGPAGPERRLVVVLRCAQRHLERDHVDIRHR